MRCCTRISILAIASVSLQGGASGARWCRPWRVNVHPIVQPDYSLFRVAIVAGWGRRRWNGLACGRGPSVCQSTAGGGNRGLPRSCISHGVACRGCRLISQTPVRKGKQREWVSVPQVRQIIDHRRAARQVDVTHGPQAFNATARLIPHSIQIFWPRKRRYSSKVQNVCFSLSLQFYSAHCANPCVGTHRASTSIDAEHGNRRRPVRNRDYLTDRVTIVGPLMPRRCRTAVSVQDTELTTRGVIHLLCHLQQQYKFETTGHVNRPPPYLV